MGLLAAALVVTGPVWGQAPAAIAARHARPPAKCTPARHSLERDVDVAAKFAEYQCWFGVGEFQLALDALEDACGNSGDPACLFNRALVHHAWLEVPDENEQEHCKSSHANYANFLAARPYEEPSDAARAALIELEQICPIALPRKLPPLPPPEHVIATLGKEVSLSEPSGTSPPASVTLPPRSAPLPPPPADETPDVLPWLLFGAGAASAVAATVSWVQMSRADSDLMHHRDADGKIFDDPESLALDVTRRRSQVMAWSFGAGALVLGGVGVGMLFHAGSASPGVSVGLAPGFVRLGCDGTF